MMRKLYRSSRDKKIFGLFGGIAEVYHLDATILRLLAVILTFFTSGTLFLIYLIACLIVPKEPFPGADYPFTAKLFKETAGEPFSKLNHQDPLDAMVGDLEKRALRRELEQLRAKLAKYEKGEM